MTYKLTDRNDCTLNQRVVFAILCAKSVCSDPAWNEWADRWLDGSDRTTAGGAAAVRAASAAWAPAAAVRAAMAAWVAAWPVEDAGAWAVEEAARAVEDAGAAKTLDLSALSRQGARP